MRELYKYATEMGVKDHFHIALKSIIENEAEAKEVVSKKLFTIFGYPNDLGLITYSGLNKTEFVNVKTNEILASVETISDGIVFYTETKYYGDWFK